jgi:carboxypeptidase C (cathepsin A)
LCVRFSQPAGVGLSTIEDPEQSPTNLDDASADFSAVLDVLFHDIFPQFRSNPLHVAGESFGGAYVPAFVADIQKCLFAKRRSNQRALNVSGIILLNALVSNKYASSSHYELFCREDSSPLRLNATSCAAMAEAIPECERLQEVCEVTLNSNICLAALMFCTDRIYSFFNEEVETHRRSPYDCRT